jgi:hypothetical protein
VRPEAPLESDSRGWAQIGHGRNCELVVDLQKSPAKAGNRRFALKLLAPIRFLIVTQPRSVGWERPGRRRAETRSARGAVAYASAAPSPWGDGGVRRKTARGCTVGRS